LQKTHGDEQREVGVFVPGSLESAVEAVFHALPEFVAIGLDDHAATHGSIVCEVGFLDYISIPARIILALRGYAL
jgi:hypothetical protein